MPSFAGLLAALALLPAVATPRGFLAEADINGEIVKTAESLERAAARIREAARAISQK